MTDTPKDNKSRGDNKSLDDQTNSKSDDNHVEKLDKQQIERIKGNVVYGVGYRRPPEETQFKKGQSGNPKGRPKRKHVSKTTGLLPVAEMILNEANMPITVREGDEVVEMSILNAVFKAQIAQALKGSAYAQKQVIEVITKSQQLQVEEFFEQTEFWHKYIKYWHQQMDAPRVDGEEPPELFPHPDDIVFERGKAPRFIGPTSKEAAVDIEITCQLRDTLLMQAALEARLNNAKDRTDGKNPTTTPMFAAITINDNLPERFKLNDVDLYFQLSSFNHLSKRQLLKEARSEWKSLGVPVMRGFVFTPLEKFTAKMNFMIDAINAMMSGKLDAKAISRGQYDEAAWDFVDQHEAA